jgi:hypothetical protein
MKKNVKNEEQFLPFDKKDLNEYMKECRKQAFKKLHRTHMSFFGEEVKGSISKIEKMIKKRNASEIKESILNSLFTQKAKSVKKSKGKRMGTQQAVKTLKNVKPEAQEQNVKPLQSVHSQKSMSSYKEDATPPENTNNLNKNNEINADKKKISFYHKNLEFEKKKNLELTQMRNQKLFYESVELKDKPYVSEKSKRIISKLERKPIHMRVWEDEEIKEKNLSILKQNIEVEKKYFSEININPIILKKSQNSSKYSTIEREQKFESWLDSNMKWNQKKQYQKQVMYEMKQNELEQNLENTKRAKVIINDNNLNSNRSFIERLNDDNTERKINLVKLKADLCPSFRAKTNSKVPIYIKRNLSSSFSYKSPEVNKQDSLIKNAKNYRSTNSIKSTSTMMKTIVKSKSTNNLYPKRTSAKDQKIKGSKWEGVIDRVNHSFNYRSNEEKLYKINVENSSACDRSKGDRIIFDYKFSPLLLSLANKKFVNIEDIIPKKPVASSKAKRLSLGFVAQNKRDGVKGLPGIENLHSLLKQ